MIHLEDWLSAPTKIQYVNQRNIPLVIIGEEGSGRKSLLTKWIDFHIEKEGKSNNKYKDLIISQFCNAGGNDMSYSYTIYKILIQLKKRFDVHQKIDLDAENLRRFFTFWLDVCSRKLIANISDSSQIVLVIEAGDKYIDQHLSEIIPLQYWLPLLFPDKIRLIVSIDEGTETAQYFRDQGCEILNLVPEQTTIENQIERYFARKTCTKQEVKEEIKDLILRNNKIFMGNFHNSKILLSLAFPYSSKYNETLKQIYDQLALFKFMKSEDLTPEKLFRFYIVFLSDKLIPEFKLIRLVFTLVMTTKGLTKEELFDIADITEDQFNIFRIIFREFVIKYKGLYVIFNTQLKRAIVDLNNKKKILKQSQLHWEISEVLIKPKATLRNLEERTYHLNKARTNKAYFHLKETLSNIGNFLLYFNPVNKFNLALYWSILVQKGLEPVKEYNKSIEWFQMRYLPDSQTTFQLFFQVAVFLKEFSDYEKVTQVDFRHPQIMLIFSGNKELDEIGLYNEIEAMGMYFGPLNLFKSGQKQTEITKFSQPQVLQDWEDQNVDIPSKRKRMRDHFVSVIKEQSKGVLEMTQLYQDEVSEIDETERKRMITQKDFYTESQTIKYFGAKEKLAYYNPRQSQIEWEKAKQERKLNFLESLRGPDKQIKSQIGTEKEKIYYYYKRWIWMQFPWACESFKFNYSDTIANCYKSSTEFMPITQEWYYARTALRNSLKAKKKKLSVLESKSIITLKKNIKRAVGVNRSQSNLNSVRGKFNGMANSSMLNSNLKDSVKFKSQSVLRKRPDRSFYDTKTIMSFRYLEKMNNSLSYTKRKKLPPLSKIQRLDVSKIYTGKSQTTRNKQAKGFLSKRSHRKGQDTMFLTQPKMTDQAMLMVMSEMKKGVNKQVNFIFQSTEGLIQHYNKLIFVNKHLAHKLQRIRSENQQEQRNQKLLGGVDFRIRLKKVSLQTKVGLDKQSIIDKQCKRYEIIIYLCKTNSQQNEKCLQKLNQLLDNFNKMIKFEKHDNKKYKADLKQLCRLKKQYYDFYITKQETHANLIQSMSKTYGEQMKLDKMASQCFFLSI